MRGPYPLQVPGLSRPASMFVHSVDDVHVSRRIAEEGIWESYETQVLRKLLGDGKVLLDVGANIGYYTVIGSQCVGESGRVIAFEPEARNYFLLQHNCEYNELDNVMLQHAALGERNGEISLYLNTDNLGDHQVYADDGSRAVQKVRMLVGDDCLAQYPDVRAVDLIKVDTQGAELQVLRGLVATLEKSVPDVHLIVEFCPYALRAAGHSANELLDFLQGFALPIAIIDHVEHQLAPISYSALYDWVAAVEVNRQDQGFMNLLLGPMAARAV